MTTVPADAGPAIDMETERDGAAATGAVGVGDAPAERRPRLAHEPALDGLRGLAVGAVLLFHLERLDGGFLGVDLFFVLSGFLITSLLVVEHQGRGAIDLGRFWARRARRLLPALLALLVAVSVLLLTLTPEDQRARFRGEALATLGYVANWHRLSIDIGYWEIFEQPSPLDHTWSLAIEEQFYVLWPLVALLVLGTATFAGRRLRRGPGDGSGTSAAAGGTTPSAADQGARESRRRLLGWVALGGAVVSFGLMAVHYSPIDTDRAYFGTDSRIGATLLGAGLAVFVAGRTSSARPAATDGDLSLPPFQIPRGRGRGGRAWSGPVREAAGWLGLAWLGWSVFTIDGLGSWYYQGGLVAFSLATLAVIWAVTGEATGLLASLLAWAPLRWLGLISYGVYLWHWPIDVYLTHDRLHVDRWALDATRLALTLLVSFVSYRWLEQPIRHGALKGRTLQFATVGAVAVSLVAVLVATSGARPAPVQLGFGPLPVEGSDSPYLYYPDEIPPDATRVLVVGDSGTYHLAPLMADELADDGFAVASSAPYWCSVVNPEGLTRFPDGDIMDSGRCQEARRDVLQDFVDQFQPDVVLYYLANVGGLGKVRIGDEWVLDCDPSYDEYLTGAMQRDADLLTSGGARLVLATSPYTVQFDDMGTERTDCRNETYRRVAASRPDRVTTIDLNAYVVQQQQAGVEMFMDIVHLSPSGSRRVSRWLRPQMELLVAADRAASTPTGDAGG